MRTFFLLLAGLVAAAALATGCQGSGWTRMDARAGIMEEAGANRSPVIGRPAPDFTLMDQDDHQVALSHLRGRWIVLYFYPQDDTPGCACQATEFTKLLTEFKNMNADIIGISTDSTESHRLFIGKYSLAMRLLSDPGHGVMQSYGVYVTAASGEQPYGRVIRTTVIIDRGGTIRYQWTEVIPEGHTDRVRAKLSQLQRAG